MGGTRGAVIVGVVLIAVFVVFAIVSSIGRRRQWLGATIVVLIVSSGVAALFFDTDRMLAIPGLLQEVVAGKETSDASVNYRVEFYAGGLKSIGDSPIVGHGWWHRFEAASRYMAPEAAATGLGNRSAHLHNDILNFGAGAGILGIVAYFLLLAAPLAGAWFSAHDSQRKARLYAGSVLSLGFLAMGLTDSMFVYELPKTVFCLSAAVVLGFCRDSGPSSVPLPRKDRHVRQIAPRATGLDGARLHPRRSVPSGIAQRRRRCCGGAYLRDPGIAAARSVGRSSLAAGDDHVRRRVRRAHRDLCDHGAPAGRHGLLAQLHRRAARARRLSHGAGEARG